MTKRDFIKYLESLDVPDETPVCFGDETGTVYTEVWTVCSAPRKHYIILTGDYDR